MAEGQGLNPYFEGRFDGESDELCALRLTLARERDEARAIANDRDAMVDHRDRALTAMYQRVDVITQERDEARAEVEGLRSALLTLANAADDVGVQFFDMEDPPISVAQMQSATLAARAALAALQEAKP